jgi:predicted nucleic acid-binding protein
MPKILDTTLLIDYANGRPGAGETLERLFAEADDLLICDAVVAEALSRGSDAERRAISTLIDAVEYVAADPAAARWAGEARRRSDRSSPRHLGDALIAGVAWSFGATIVTRNPDDFVRMGVPVLAYEADAPG